MKTLKLLFPEWQGYGENNHAFKGAYTMYKAFRESSDFVIIDVAEEEDLIVEDGILGLSSIKNNSENALDKLNTLQPNRIFMIGGTCGSEIAPVSYLNEHYKSDLAVLWFDAHGDLNTPETSPSGHFHGMVLRTLLGNGDQSLIQMVSSQLSPSQVTLIGARELDKPEADFITTNQIPIVSATNSLDIKNVILAIEQSGCSNLYIHLDLDFFNPNDFTGAQVPTPDGIPIEKMLPILRELNSDFTIVGLSVVEFASNNFRMAKKISALFVKSGLSWSFT